MFIDNWEKSAGASRRGEFEDVDLVVGPDGRLVLRFELDDETDDVPLVDGVVVSGCYWDYINGVFEEDITRVLGTEFGIPKEVITELMEILESGKIYGYNKKLEELEARGEFDSLMSRCKEVWGE